MPKGQLTVGGRRIIDRIEEALTPVVERVLVIDRDVRPSGGSLIGIHSALTMAAQDVLVVAWDMPFVTTDLLSTIAAALRGAHAAIPVTSRPQPLCAAYAYACLPLLEAWLDAGNMRATGFVDSLPTVRRLDMPDAERLFFNANTPRALELAEEMARGG